MSDEFEFVERQFSREFSEIRDYNLASEAARYIVKPNKIEVLWDYGELGEKFPCWIVLKHPQSKTIIVYCRFGFGPKSPWGLLMDPPESMGMDCGWYPTVEEAIRESWIYSDEIIEDEKKRRWLKYTGNEILILVGDLVKYQVDEENIYEIEDVVDSENKKNYWGVKEFGIFIKGGVFGLLFTSVDSDIVFISRKKEMPPNE